jgi:arsenite methyltransferase
MAEMTRDDEVRAAVRERYAAAARAEPCDCESAVFGSALYREGASEPAVQASLGCGVPTAVAELRPGETVLDLGSGAGADVLISARRVGPTGRAIGLDMTDEMLALARRHATEAGVANTEFVKGYIEAIPLPDESVDVVISNCVINLAADKRAVIREAARVLKPGGRFAVSDVIADPEIDPAARADLAACTGCIAGALNEDEFRAALAAAGLVDAEVRPTHRVHAHAAAAIVRALKPEAIACSLDAAGRAEQAARYRALAAHVEASERGNAELVVKFGADVDGELLAEAVAVERACCPFFEIAVDGRRLTVGVADPAHAAAVDALADVLLNAR